MNRTDRAVWRKATTLPQLGELTAQWLEGTLPSVFGWAPGEGPHDETKPLIPTLAGLNRAGFVTRDSQPGEDSPWLDGRLQQRAAVEGFADQTTLDWLTASLVGTRYQVIATTVVRLADPAGLYEDTLNGGVPVTLADGHRCTWYGRQLTRTYLSQDIAMGDLCRVTCQLAASWQVTVFDPKFGPNTLWPVLDRAVRPRRPPRGEW